LKKLSALLVIFTVTILSYFHVYACTSFAVYSQNTVYGMNFDYPDAKIRYSVSAYDGVKVFHMDVYMFNNFATIAAMNDKGFFVSIQQLYPDGPIVKELSENQVEMHDFAAATPYYTESVEEVIRYISDKKVVNHYLTIHDLFADRTGNAMVLEAGENGSVISRMDGKFIVMTNFANSELKNKDYKDVNGAGSDRYATAYDYISEHIDTFDLDKGFGVLKNTVQDSGYHPTQSSMVFDPENAAVYIAIKQDFSKIWKVDIQKGTVEGYKGFENPVELEINEDGILADELISLANTDQEGKKAEDYNSLYFICLAFIAIIFTAIIITTVIRFRRHRKALK